VGTRPSAANAVPPLEAPPKPTALATPPKPAPAVPTPEPVALATPPKPAPAVPTPVAPAKPNAHAAPPKPAPAFPAPPTAGSQPHHAAVLPFEAARPSPPPPAPADAALEPDTITTAGPFALATSTELTPAEVTFLPPKRMLRVLVAGIAVLAIGAATWWIASRGSASQPVGDRETPSAIAQPTAAPGHRSTTETPTTSAAVGQPALRAEPAAENSPGAPSQGALALPNALGPAASPSAGRSATPLPIQQHPFPPTGPGPAKLKHSSGHHGYDPEGI
jgi:hypothetical protein